jgi:hypothetical protein
MTQDEYINRFKAIETATDPKARQAATDEFFAALKAEAEGKLRAAANDQESEGCVLSQLEAGYITTQLDMIPFMVSSARENERTLQKHIRGLTARLKEILGEEEFNRQYEQQTPITDEQVKEASRKARERLLVMDAGIVEKLRKGTWKESGGCTLTHEECCLVFPRIVSWPL